MGSRIKTSSYKACGTQFRIDCVQPFWPSKLIKSVHTCLLSSQRGGTLYALILKPTNVTNSTEDIGLVNVTVCTIIVGGQVI